jgi:putative ABC transport system permease protein
MEPTVPRHGGTPGLLDGNAAMSIISVGYGFFEFYGVKPLAGRLFRPASNDQVPLNPTADRMAHYVINQTAVRLLGYATPQAAVGQTLNFVSTLPPPKPGDPPAMTALNGTIVGVVPDFSLTPRGRSPFGNRNNFTWGTAYSVGIPETNAQGGPELMHVRLTGRDIPETLVAIDAVWKQSSALDPIDRTFLDAYIQSLEVSVIREGQAFAVFAVIAMLLACLGLVGVSLSTTTRRIKEIGVRKAMGATTGEIVVLLLWQFSKPVLWANLIAWPLAWWLMNRWLAGFPQHVTVQAWLFPATGAITLALALATVAGQATASARQKPVLALRYE